MEQIVQIISFTISNDSTFEKSYSKDRKRWKTAMRHIKEQKGWLQTLWGRDFHSSNKLDLFIIWADIHSAEAFKASSTFQATLSWIAISSLAIHSVSLRGSIFTQGPTEMMTLCFSNSLPEEDLLAFESQVGRFLAELLSADSPHKLPTSMAYGWTVSEIQHEQEGLKACVVLILWDSLDQMYNVKQDKNSLFNNLFVPLLKDALNGSTAALYTQLNDVEAEGSRCALCEEGDYGALVTRGKQEPVS